MNFLNTLVGHLNLIPAIAQAAQQFKTIGTSKETTIQKIGGIVETAASIGEAVPVAQVQAISGIVEAIAESIFGTPATPAV